MTAPDWDRIEHDDGLHRFLSDIETLPQIGAVSISDAGGHIRASGRSFPAPPADASDRAAFVAQRDRDAGIFVGREHTDQLTQASDFDISRRRSTPDGSFDGVIAVSARPEYFSDFLSTVSGDENFSALLVRSDGSVLVRYPTLPGALVFTPDRPIMQAIATEPNRGLFWGRGGTDGIERLFGYQRIGGYPLYVVFGMHPDVWCARLVASQPRQLLAVCGPCCARPVLHDVVRRAPTSTPEGRQLALANNCVAA